MTTKRRGEPVAAADAQRQRNSVKLGRWSRLPTVSASETLALGRSDETGIKKNLRSSDLLMLLLLLDQRPERVDKRPEIKEAGQTRKQEEEEGVEK